MTAVITDGIRHTYPSKKEPGEALRGIDLSVNQREIFGLLGPNGSGKTTLFKILATLIIPTAGSARIFGKDIIGQVNEVRNGIGVVFQQPSLDRKLTVEENLVHQGHLYGLTGRGLNEKIKRQLEVFGISDRKKDFVEKLSGGLMRRVELAKGMIHEPRLLILDEPSTGLDPGARRNLRETLDNLREREGVTILMTTHLASEAERCGRIAVMDEGRIVAEGRPDDLKKEIGGDVINVTSHSPRELMEKIRVRFGGEPTVVNGDVRVEMERGHEFIPKLVETFPGLVSAVTVGKPTLEDVFIHRTGRSIRAREKE
ncbi:MAG: daunorubicin resistance protein DrrA family ABC transporter ATP-binding protein [bacterium]|nr:MAG: daunorubicin resistance protein DrrA family ABC transporter ATP-binding protein [bacterium]